MPYISPEDRKYLVDFITDLAQKQGNPMSMSILDSSIDDEERFVNLCNVHGSLTNLVQALEPEIEKELNAKGMECLYVPSLPRKAIGDSEIALLDGYPMYINPDDALLEGQISDMHGFAFMGWWNNTYKQLKRLTGYNGNDSHIWTGIIAKQFAQARSKNELIYREFSNGNEVCIFRTGLRTIAGKMIVAVLVPNPGERQPWVLSEYTYVGNVNGTYGLWLLDIIEEKEDKSSVMAELRARIWQDLELLDSEYYEIQDSLQRLAAGYIIDEKMRARVRTYLDKGVEFSQRANLLSESSVDYENKKIHEMFEEIGASGILMQLKQLEDAVAELLQHVEKILRTILSHNTSDNSHAIARCRNFISSAGASIRNGGDPSLYLSDYKGWIELFGQLVHALWEGEVQQPEKLDSEFKISTIMAGMLHDHLRKADERENEAVPMKLREVEEKLAIFEEAIQGQSTAEEAAEPTEEAASDAEEESEVDESEEIYTDDSADDFEDIDAEEFAISYMSKEYMEEEADSEEKVEEKDDGAEQSSAPPKVQEAAPSSSAMAAFDWDVVEKCKNGEIDPEMYLLKFGEWKYAEGPVDYSGMHAEEVAFKMLTSAAARSEDGIILCLNHAINQKKLQLSQWLVHSLGPGCHKALYGIIVKMQYLLANEAADDKPHMMAEICRQMRYIWDELPNCEYKMRVNAAAMIMAQIHHMITRYFQVDTVQELLTVFGECKWLPEGEIGNLLKRMQEHIVSPNADPAFLNNHRDMSSKLIAVNSLEHRKETLTKLRNIGLSLKGRFENCGIDYGNARNVIRGFVTERSMRTLAMLNSLIEGRVLEGAVAFESADKMMDYANEQQRTFLDISNPDDIVGSARNAVLSYMGELNDAFVQLCAVDTEDAETSEKVLRWYKLIIADLNEWRNLAAAYLKSFPADDLFDYLRSINECSPLELVWNDSEIDAQLHYEYENLNSWPLFNEDELICALMEVSGRVPELSTHDLGYGVLLKEKPQNRIQTLIDRMLKKCCDLNKQLSEMKRFSAINLEECSSLLDILNHNYGWLQRIKQQIEKGAFENITIPLVRYEMEIWYVDKRIGVIFGVVADSVKDSIEKHASGGNESEYENLVQEIDDAVSRRDMSFITERFSDVVSSIAYLGAKENHASMFFDKDVMRALAATIATEKWTKQQVNRLEVEKYRRLRTVMASNDEIKTVGRAISIASEYVKDKDSLSDERLNRLQKLFDFLGFGNPLLTRQDDRLNLSVSTPDRSICPIPQLGIGIAMRDPTRDNHWCVNYQVRIMKGISEVNAIISSALGWLNETITILLCPFVIKASERRDLLKQVREVASSRNLFLVDKCFLRFAMCLSGAERLNAFYSCTSSLMKLDPYTVITERQWEGTFFGREGEIDRVIRMDGCHVLYGGRRLGKTSIMREAEFRWLNSGTNRIALYVNLQDIANSDMLWYKVARELSNTIQSLSVFRNENATEDDANKDARLIVRYICEYLRENDCYLLLLLDECDELVYRDAIRNSNQERNRGTSRVGELVKLMNESRGHCKVVLAGLDRVTRFIRNLNAYNMVLRDNYNGYQCFTESICIRPMLGSDMQNAYDLIDIPFKMMGYRMDRESILYILRVCCFRPNLIQNYCRALLEVVRVRDAVQFEEDSLYMHIPYEMVRGIQEGRNAATDYLSQQAEQSIRIPLNVGETAVYAPIAYAVALLSLRNSLKGMFTGFKAQEILALIDAYNPEFTKGMPQSNGYISTILEELVYMGILRSVNNPESTTYALFSNYMMKMLGDDATIEAQLIESLETHIARNKTSSEEIARRELFLERFITEDSFIFPLTSAQLEKLNNALKQSGYAVIVGSEMLRISDVSAMFARIRIDSVACEVHQFGAEEFAVDGVQKLASCFAQSDDGQDKRLILILDGGWTREMVDWVAERDDRGNVNVVFLAKPDMCWHAHEILMEMPEKNTIYLSRIARSFRIGWFNWDNTKQKHRFGEDATILGKLSERIGAITGDWPEMIMRFRSLMQSEPYATFDELEREFLDIIHRQNRGEIARQLGFEYVDEQIWDLLRMVDSEVFAGPEENGLANRDNLSDILDLADDRDLMMKTVRYMQMLGLVEVNGDVLHPETCVIRLNPFADRIMKGGDE